MKPTLERLEARLCCDVGPFPAVSPAPLLGPVGGVSSGVQLPPVSYPASWLLPAPLVRLTVAPPPAPPTPPVQPPPAAHGAAGGQARAESQWRFG